MENIQQYYCRQQHILLLRDDSKIIDDHLPCEICDHPVTAPYFVCSLCKYYVHKSCAELPQQINLSYHPRHPLTLHRRFSACHFCPQNFENALMYGCFQCDLSLDVECALMSISTTTCPKGQEHCYIQHSSHPHSLLLIDTKFNKDMRISCFACMFKNSRGRGVFYGCKRCKYFLHKQCIDELPQEIQSPIHSHLLFLRFRRFGFICNFCTSGVYYIAFSFECPLCDFQLCFECGTGNVVRIPINYEYHEHPLYFQEKTYTRDRCNAYDCYGKLAVISNSKEFNIKTSSTFRCVDCDFKLHLHCAPLPCTIKHECHVDPLILVDSFIEDYSGQYYCDICESKRDPHIRVYCCDQCKYIAHVDCVILEILNVLKDDHRDVKLKSMGEDLWRLPEEIDNKGVQEKEQDRPLLTLRDLIAKLTPDELRWLEDRFYWDEDNNGEEEVSQRTSNLEAEYETVDEVLRFSSFITERDFNNLSKDDFDFGTWDTKLKINSSDLALKIVNVEGHWIPITLASVLKYLLQKYGDISSKSRSSPAVKSISYFFLCQVMKKMHTTLVIDITKDLLQHWNRYVRFVYLWAGFDVGFLKASLEDIKRAFFCLQIGKLDLEIPRILQKEIEKYEAKIAQCKAKIETCTKLRKSSLQQEFMKKSLNKVMKLKWKTAGEFRFDDSCLD